MNMVIRFHASFPKNVREKSRECQVAWNNALDFKDLFTLKEWQITSLTNGTARASDTRKMTIGFCSARSVIVSFHTDNYKLNSENVARSP